MTQQIDITAAVLVKHAPKSFKAPFKAFKAAHSLGLVRLVKVEDTFYNFADLCGDMYNPEANDNIPADQLAREKRNFKARVNRVGVWDIQLQCRALPTDDWQVIDAMGGNIGDDWIGSGYDTEYLTTGEKWVKEHGGIFEMMQAIEVLTK